VAGHVAFREPRIRTDPENIRSIEPQLKAFFAVQERRARAHAAGGQPRVPAVVWKYFAAASRGDWDQVARLYFRIADRSYHFRPDSDWIERLPAWLREAMDRGLPSLAANRRSHRLETPVWQTINESYRAFEQLAAANPKHVLVYGKEIVGSMPPGSILFGGTDAGRFVVTFLSDPSRERSHLCVVSQNGLTDTHYLEFARSNLVDHLHLPGLLDIAAAYDEARPRLPQQGATNQAGRRRQTLSAESWAVDANARLAKRVFDNNLSSDFFLDEQYSMDWAYPRAVPSGLIFKLCREPVVVLDEEMVRRDRKYWNRRVLELIGERVTEQTTIQEICTFAQDTYLRRDLTKFRGSREFVETVRRWSSLPDFLGAAAIYSKSRANFAHLYYWRAQNARDGVERERMLVAMDLAVRQAIALCPYQKDAVYWCITCLSARRKWEDAFLVLNTARKFHAKDRRFEEWVGPLEKWLQEQASPENLTFDRFLSNFTPPTRVFP